MKKLILSSLLLMSFTLFGQKLDQQGYIIKANGEKVDCYLSSSISRQNPTSFEYSLESNGEVLEGNLQNSIGFGVPNLYKYVKAGVKIDQSSTKLATISNNENPEWKYQTVFLKVELQGKASLYSYLRGGSKRFFYNIDDEPIEQLVQKKYMATSTKMGTNNQYRRTLREKLDCEAMNLDDYRELKYSSVPLSDVFKKYNECANAEMEDFSKSSGKAEFRLKAKGGVNFESNSVDAQNSNLSVDFENQTSFSFGAEFEIVWPFDNQKWSTILSPSFRSYKDEQEIFTSSLANNTQTVNNEFVSVELPVGVRRYFPINDSLNLFFDLSFVFDITSKNDLIYSVSGDRSNSQIGSGFGLGTGININRFDIHFMYKAPRNLLKGAFSLESKFNSTSVKVAYRIL